MGSIKVEGQEMIASNLIVYGWKGQAVENAESEDVEEKLRGSMWIIYLGHEMIDDPEDCCDEDVAPSTATLVTNHVYPTQQGCRRQTSALQMCYA